MIKENGVKQHDILGLGMGMTYQDADAAIVEYNKEQRMKAEIKEELKAELEEVLRVEKPAKVEDIDIDVDLALEDIELAEDEVDTEINFSVDASALAEDFEKERIKDVVKEVLPQTPVVVNVSTSDKTDIEEKRGFFRRLSVRFQRGGRRLSEKIQDLIVSIILSLLATTALFFIVNCGMYMSSHGIKLSEAEKLGEVAQYGWSQVVWVVTTKLPEWYLWVKRLCGIY